MMNPCPPPTLYLSSVVKLLYFRNVVVPVLHIILFSYELFILSEEQEPKKGKRKTRTSGRGTTKEKGKKKQKTRDVEESPCGICSRNCEIDSVCCDLCDKWYHFVCLGVAGDEDEFDDKKDWYCGAHF